MLVNFKAICLSFVGSKALNTVPYPPLPILPTDLIVYKSQGIFPKEKDIIKRINSI